MIKANDPLWLMLVGPSGAGKTVLLKSLRKVGGMHLLGDLDTKAAFLSGVEEEGADGGEQRGVAQYDGEYGRVPHGTNSRHVLELPAPIA